MDDNDLFKRLLAALEPGMKLTLTVEKPAAESKPGNVVKCPHCGWKHHYSRHDAARRGWEAHKKTCKARKDTPVESPQWLKDQTEGRKL